MVSFHVIWFDCWCWWIWFDFERCCLMVVWFCLSLFNLSSKLEYVSHLCIYIYIYMFRCHLIVYDVCLALHECVRFSVTVGSVFNQIKFNQHLSDSFNFQQSQVTSNKVKPNQLTWNSDKLKYIRIKPTQRKSKSTNINRQLWNYDQIEHTTNSHRKSNTFMQRQTNIIHN